MLLLGFPSNIRLVISSENDGLANAQNIGIIQAKKLNASTILILDQDTILPPSAVRVLSDALITLTSKGTLVGAVAPVYRDLNSNVTSGLARACGIRVKEVARSEVGIDECDFAIASGTLIPIEVIQTVGPMETGLFIDLVDMEWCFRARQRGYSVFQVKHAVVHHILGEGRVRVFMTDIPRHAPVRNYYWVRNALLLARRSYVPIAWRLFLVSRAVAFAAIYPIFGDRRSQRIRYIAMGFWEGIRGRAGKVGKTVMQELE